MFKQDYQTYFSSEVNPLQSTIEYFKNTQEYIDLLALFTVIYRVVCDPEIFYNKFLLLNSKYGIIADFLKDRKKDSLLISPNYEDFYFLPFEYRNVFKIVDWRSKNSIRLFYNSDILIDFNFQFDNLNILNNLFNFLNLNNNPLLILLFNSNIPIDTIIDYFEKKSYIFDSEKKEKIISILLNKIKIYDLNRLLIFNYNQPKIIKEDIGLCLEQ